jgi:hypothetical protein
MSDAQEIQRTSTEGLSPDDNAALNEAAWQKWVNWKKERDAAHRSKLIRVAFNRRHWRRSTEYAP